jgi:hypothetical protein
MSYQWAKGTTTISGATNSTYSVTGAGTADSASYTVTISNFKGSVTSDSATVTVNAAAPSGGSAAGGGGSGGGGVVDGASACGILCLLALRSLWKRQGR